MAGTDGKWLHFDYVPGEVEVRTGAAGVTGRLCVIGAELKEDVYKRQWPALRAEFSPFAGWVTPPTPQKGLAKAGTVCYTFDRCQY